MAAKDPIRRWVEQVAARDCATLSNEAVDIVIEARELIEKERKKDGLQGP